VHTYIWWNPGEPIPSLAHTSEEGILALSDFMDINQLREAYKHGVFPWYGEYEPVIWWCPDPRFVLFPDDLKVSKSMQQLFRKHRFEVTYNQNFELILQNCAYKSRKDQEGTWLTPDLMDALLQLHREGLAHSCEVWSDGCIVGGLYGIKMGGIFFGESMFYDIPNASKYGFISMVNKLKEEGVKLIDCQVHTPHLESLGAKFISREVFLSLVKAYS